MTRFDYKLFLWLLLFDPVRALLYISAASACAPRVLVVGGGGDAETGSYGDG